VFGAEVAESMGGVETGSFGTGSAATGSAGTGSAGTGTVDAGGVNAGRERLARYSLTGPENQAAVNAGLADGAVVPQRGCRASG